MSRKSRENRESTREIQAERLVGLVSSPVVAESFGELETMLASVVAESSPTILEIEMDTVVETPVETAVAPVVTSVEMECLAELVKASQVKPSVESLLAAMFVAPTVAPVVTIPVAPVERVLRGVKAITGAPTRDDLPVVEAGLKDKTGMVIDRWIAELIRSGHTLEAGAVGNLYNKLVRHNLISVPESPILIP